MDGSKVPGSSKLTWSAAGTEKRMRAPLGYRSTFETAGRMDSAALTPGRENRNSTDTAATVQANFISLPPFPPVRGDVFRMISENPLQNRICPPIPAFCFSPETVIMLSGQQARKQRRGASCSNVEYRPAPEREKHGIQRGHRAGAEVKPYASGKTDPNRAMVNVPMSGSTTWSVFSNRGKKRRRRWNS